MSRQRINCLEVVVDREHLVLLPRIVEQPDLALGHYIGEVGGETHHPLLGEDDPAPVGRALLTTPRRRRILICIRLQSDPP